MGLDHRPAAEDDFQIFAPPAGQRPAQLIASTPDGAIDEDLYCMTCGYNLRGLSGDPVRCPECGGRNSLGVVAVPAAYIRSALRHMETAPTLDVALALGAAACVLLAVLLPWPELFYPIVPGVALVVMWWATFQYTKRSFAAQAGWGRIVLDFHIAAVLIDLPVVSLAVVVYVGHPQTGSGPSWPGPSWSLYVFVALAVASFLAIPWGLRIYRAARRRLTTMQHEAAVRIAREVIHRQLRPRSGG